MKRIKCPVLGAYVAWGANDGFQKTLDHPQPKDKPMAEIRPNFRYEVVFTQAEYQVLLKLLAGTPLTPEERITQETLGEALRARALELHQDRARRLNSPSEGAKEKLSAPRPGEVER